MITVTINGKKIALEKSTTILKAARSAGIEIPTLCNHPLLEPFGGCRLCVVEVDKMPKLQTSCTQYISDGMVVFTESDKVVEARKAMLEFLLINHPLDCPYCDKAGECDLQDVAMKYGPTTGRFAEGKRTHPEKYDDPLIVTNMDRCILCARCTRMCEDVQGASALTVTNRGAHSFVEPFSGGRFDCEYCGNCITVCPVGSLMSRLHKHEYRPWYIEENIETVCSYCGVGCSMMVQVRGGSIVRVEPRPRLGVNNGLLCVKGRFGYDYVASAQRLRSPMIRKDGELRTVTWSEAFVYIAERLKAIKEKHGPDAIGAVASGRCTNEDNYLLQKFMRVVLGSNNIDSTAGLAYAPALKFFEEVFGQGVTANPMQGITRSDGVLVIGGDPASVNPVLGLKIRAASRKGVPVVTIGYVPGLKRFASHSLSPNPFTEPLVLNMLLSELMKKRPICGENTFFEEIIKRFMLLPDEDAAQRCGITPEDLKAVVDDLLLMTNPAVIVGGDIVQRSGSDANLLLISVLVYMLNGRIYLLSGLPNEQGLVDMGCMPDMLPGARPLAVDTFRKRYGDFFSSEAPSAAGLGLMGMMDAARLGGLKALYVMGSNPLLSLPDVGRVGEALSKLEFLVVQDIFPTETTRFAHAVLPGLSWAEKEGSFTNLEGRLQRLRKAVHAEGMDDWKIITEICRVLGSEMDYRDSQEVFSEIAEVSPLHKGLSYKDMASGKCMWPYKGEPLRQGGIEGFVLPDIKSLLKKRGGEKIYLGIDAPLYVSGGMGRNSAALGTVSPSAGVKMGGGLAERLSVSGGSLVSVSTVAGAVQLPVVIDSDVPAGMVLLPAVYDGGSALGMMHWSFNKRTGCPALDDVEVEVKKVNLEVLA
jgi:NADH-quinone oxidoreductase chain G